MVCDQPRVRQIGQRGRERIVRAHGVTGPFLYYLGNVDRRKNVLGLVDAYARLPEGVRDAYPLVLTFGRNDWFSALSDSWRSIW